MEIFYLTHMKQQTNEKIAQFDENGDYLWVKDLKELLHLETTGTLETIKATGSFRQLVGFIRILEQKTKEATRLSTIQEVEGNIPEVKDFEEVLDHPEIYSDGRKITNLSIPEYMRRKGFNQALSDVLQVLESMKG